MNASSADTAIAVEKKEDVTANAADVLTNNSIYNAVWHIYLFMWKFDIFYKPRIYSMSSYPSSSN